jgi:hypothetical protein
MQLNISGRRYFRHLPPEKPYIDQKSNLNVFQFPDKNPYSWTIFGKEKNLPFDWI